MENREEGRPGSVLGLVSTGAPLERFEVKAPTPPSGLSGNAIFTLIIILGGIVLCLMLPILTPAVLAIYCARVFNAARSAKKEADEEAANGGRPRYTPLGH